jgi:hypothetical protein
LKLAPAFKAEKDIQSSHITLVASRVDVNINEKPVFCAILKKPLPVPYTGQYTFRIILTESILNFNPATPNSIRCSAKGVGVDGHGLEHVAACRHNH